MSKYALSDDHEWADEQEAAQERDTPRVTVDMHTLVINDEREEIERYNGLQWWFVIADGLITGVDVSHYCPGPGHTDPMGFVSWADVPKQVQSAVLRELNARDAGEVVDIEAIADIAETRP